MQQKTNENKINETSGKVFSKDSLRFVKEDLAEILEDIYSAQQKLEGDKQLATSLEIAYDQVEDVIDEIQEREDECDELVKSIAS